MSEKSCNTFQIGLALAGAISAGAYTAGVLDFLFQALDEWERARGTGDAPPGLRAVSLGCRRRDAAQSIAQAGPRPGRSRLRGGPRPVLQDGSRQVLQDGPRPVLRDDRSLAGSAGRRQPRR